MERTDVRCYGAAAAGRCDSARADVIDDRLAQAHTPLSWFQNPHPERGAIKGIAGNCRDEFTLVWDNGDVGRFHEGEQMPFAQFATGITHAQGISYVTPGAGIAGDIAVADSSGFETYAFSGSRVASYGILTGGSIKDIKIELGKVLVGTTTGFGYRKDDGTLNAPTTGNTATVSLVNLVDGLNDRIGVAGSGNGIDYSRLDGNLAVIPSSNVHTDYLPNEGVGLTQNELMFVANDHVVRYDNPFKSYMALPLERPRLTISGRSSVTLSWPTNATSFVLQSSPTPTGSYTNVSASPLVSGTNYTVSLLPDQPAAWFRLCSTNGW